MTEFSDKKPSEISLGDIDGDELENALNKSAIWAVTYGDMMSYLMIFFLVLFSVYSQKTLKSVSTVKVQKSLASIEKVFGGEIKPELVEKIKRIDEDEALAYKLKKSDSISELSDMVLIQSNEEHIRLVLPESLSFDSGKAVLKEPIRSVLDDMIALVQNHPNDIIVEGHTDNVPIYTREFRNNYFLSSARAYAVVEYLLSKGIPKEKLSGLGYGDVKPVSDNHTLEGRAKNRRVEVLLVKR